MPTDEPRSETRKRRSITGPDCRARATLALVVHPPPLPPRLSDVPTIVGLGSALWAVAAVALLVTGGTGPAVATCVCGAVLGGLGHALFRWQRNAARRGTRGAQDGLTDR